MSYDVIASSVDSAVAEELVKFWTLEEYYGFTSSALDRTHAGELYEARWPIKVGEVKGDAIKGDSNVEITLPSNHPLALKFEGGVPDREWNVALMLGHDGDAEVITLWTGIIVTCNFEELSGTQASYSKLVCQSRMAALKQPGLPYRYGSSCQHAVYRGGCNLNLSENSYLYTLSFVDSVTLKSPSFALHPDGEFTAGVVEFDDVFRSVISHVGDTVVLRRPIKGLAAGAAVSIARGCDRSYERCAVLGNTANIFRFDVPGRDIFKEGLV